jgi:hypothetical protein
VPGQIEWRSWESSCGGFEDDLSIPLQSLWRLGVDRRTGRMTDRPGDTIGEGDLLSRRARDYRSARWDAAVEARFWSKVRRAAPQECWEWQGSLNPAGYGTFSIDSKSYAAHRLSLFKSVLNPDAAKVCDHLCRNPRCVNPAHLELVTNRENVRRGIAGMLNKIKGALVTHCKRGHKYTPENTIPASGRRACRTCERDRSKIAKAEARARKRARTASSTREGL